MDLGIEQRQSVIESQLYRSIKTEMPKIINLLSQVLEIMRKMKSMGDLLIWSGCPMVACLSQMIMPIVFTDLPIKNLRIFQFNCIFFESNALQKKDNYEKADF